MCGRYARFNKVDRLLRPLGVQWEGPDLFPNYNTAPGQPVLAVRQRDAHREAVLLRWGLIPAWAKDKAIGYRMINARAEGIADKPAFRQPFARQRCLIPADGFYEWRQNEDGRKQPWYIHRLDGEPLAFAGLWARWQDSEVIESCAIITGTPNAVVAPIHDRMPVILEPADYTAWLESDNPLLLQQLLQPIPAELLEAYPMGLARQQAANGGPGLIEPLTGAG